MNHKKHFTTRCVFISASGFGGVSLYGLWAAASSPASPHGGLTVAWGDMIGYAWVWGFGSLLFLGLSALLLWRKPVSRDPQG
jgi:hypothetical protein